MMNLYNEYDIAIHWACPLLYGDYSGLTDEEIIQVDAFINGLPESCTFDFSDEEAGFLTDEISGLKANCIELKVFFWLEPEEC